MDDLKMTKIVPLRCTACGANLPRETLICEYCGTNFVLSEAEAAVQAEPRHVSGKMAGVSAESMRVTKEDMEDFIEDYDEGRCDRTPPFKEGDLDLDDRVDRKIIRYINETIKRRDDAGSEKYIEFDEERTKLRHFLKSGQIDEDTFDDLLNQARKKYDTATSLIKGLDAGEALATVKDFIVKGVKNKLNDFNGIKYTEKIVFNSVDGKASGESFVYRITGRYDCLVKSGMFSTKPAKKYFSAEVDYKTFEIISFRWELDDPLNVQEYRARPLALPKFS